MIVTKKQRRNLEPAKKGEVRNPKGISGSRCKEKLAKLVEGTISIRDLNTGRSKKLPYRDVMLMKLIKNSIDDKNSASEQIKAVTTIMERLEGKAVQPISGPEGIPLQPPIINIIPIGVIENEPD